MELFKGTHGDYIILDGYTGRISIHKRKKNWFEGSVEATTVTFPLSALDHVSMEKVPGLFRGNQVTLVFDSDDNVFRSYTLEIPRYADQRQAHRLFRAVQEIKREFT